MNHHYLLHCHLPKCGGGNTVHRNRLVRVDVDDYGVDVEVGTILALAARALDDTLLDAVVDVDEDLAVRDETMNEAGHVPV